MSGQERTKRTRGKSEKAKASDEQAALLDMLLGPAVTKQDMSDRKRAKLTPKKLSKAEDSEEQAMVRDDQIDTTAKSGGPGEARPGGSRAKSGGRGGNKGAFSERFGRPKHGADTVLKLEESMKRHLNRVKTLQRECSSSSSGGIGGGIPPTSFNTQSNILTPLLLDDLLRQVQNNIPGGIRLDQGCSTLECKSFDQSIPSHRRPMCEICRSLAEADHEREYRRFCKYGLAVVCEREGCAKHGLRLAEGDGYFCSRHGGGPRCQQEGCAKHGLRLAEGDGYFCVRHGGGPRCEQEGCEKAGRYRAEGDGYFCGNHSPKSKVRRLGKLLCEASSRGLLTAVNELLATGVDVNHIDAFGTFPLCRASESGQLEVVKALLDAKADVNKTNKHGQTPLYWASQKGHLKVVEALLGAKADVSIASQNGWTPLDKARDGGHSAIVELLLHAGAIK